MNIERRSANRRGDTPVFRIDRRVLNAVLRTIGIRRAETGGAIGAHSGADKITAYAFDRSSRSSPVTYSPDYEALNALFKAQWNPRGIRLQGFIHSHPPGLLRPSSGDLRYARAILDAIQDLDFLWLPIVNTVPDTGGFSMSAWRVGRDGHLQEGVVEVDDYSERERPGLASARATDGPSEQFGAVQESARQTFERVSQAYDLNTMARSRLIVVGAGGAAAWIEDLARAGIGQFVLIDPDVVSETNLATQQTYRSDIGRPKVTCLKERLLDINPDAVVTVLQQRLEELDDEEFARLAVEAQEGRLPQQTLLCALTDDFTPQARSNRLALKLGLPSLAGQVYREGRGAEITFTYPGVTPACHRCILSSRYAHFLDQGRANDVTSHGTPIFATGRLNALKGYVALALLHHGTGHPRWGGLLKTIGNRNLIQLRLDPEIADTLGLTVFDRVLGDDPRVFFDEPVWLPQAPENPSNGYEPCPDCGGTGDLRDSMGRIDDTREIPPQYSTPRSPATEPKEA